MYGALFVLALAAGSALARVGDKNWESIHEGQPPSREFDPVNFKNHPLKHGLKLKNVFPALYIDHNHNLNFGQATELSIDQFEGVFHTENGVEKLNGGFRILVNSREFRDFGLIKPERYNPREYTLVDFEDAVNYKRTLILMYEPDTDSSYFGTLIEKNGQKVAHGVNYDGASVEVRGVQATSGEYTLYIVNRSPRE